MGNLLLDHLTARSFPTAPAQATTHGASGVRPQKGACHTARFQTVGVGKEDFGLFVNRSRAEMVVLSSSINDTNLPVHFTTKQHAQRADCFCRGAA